MVNLDVAIRMAQPSDQSRISGLIYFEPSVHRHLDWRTPLDWLGVPEYWVAEHNHQIAAALACPPDPKDIAWIRLFASSVSMPANDAWNVLWQTAKESLAQRHRLTVAAIVMHNWFKELLEASAFIEQQKIILLEHNTTSFPRQPMPAGIEVRPMQLADLPAVARLDSEAFVPLWHNSPPSLQRAFSQAGFATVALAEGQMVGYQISTKNPFGAHLARLAISPAFQGHGLGYTLIQDLLGKMHNVNIFRLTVNTQSDNLASLALYQKIGFALTGEQYPVLTYQF